AATHSRIKHLYVPDRKPMSFGRTLRELRATFSNRPLLTLVATNFLISVPAGVTSGLASYMYIHLWGLKPQDIGPLLAFAPFGSFIALWAAPRLSARFGKKPVMLALYASWLVVAIVPFTIWLVGLAPPPGSLGVRLLLGADLFIGVGFAVGVHIILNSM